MGNRNFNIGQFCATIAILVVALTTHISSKFEGSTGDSISVIGITLALVLVIAGLLVQFRKRKKPRRQRRFSRSALQLVLLLILFPLILAVFVRAAEGYYIDFVRDQEIRLTFCFGVTEGDPCPFPLGIVELSDSIKTTVDTKAGEVQSQRRLYLIIVGNADANPVKDGVVYSEKFIQDMPTIKNMPYRIKGDTTLHFMDLEPNDPVTNLTIAFMRAYETYRAFEAALDERKRTFEPIIIVDTLSNNRKVFGLLTTERAHWRDMLIEQENE